MSGLIYADQAATSFPKPPEVIRAVEQAMKSASASPGRSAHQMSVQAARTVFAAREAMADILGAEDSGQIAFFLNVTQALNVALYGLLRPGDHVLTTPLEHNSVLRPLSWLQSEARVEVEVIPADAFGCYDPVMFSRLRRSNTRLVVVNHASNVTGLISPLEEIKAEAADLPVIVDVAQSAGVLDLTSITGSADGVAFTGHKGLLGPTGTGGLWIKPDLKIKPLFRGGTGSLSEKEEQPDFMPDALEAGTHNTHGLAGLTAGVEFIQKIGVASIRAHEMELTRVFLDGLRQMAGVQVYGPLEASLRVAVVSINVAGWSPSDLAHALERQYGILTRPGLHCAPRYHRTLGTFPSGTVRFSFGWFNTRAEVDLIIRAIDELASRSYQCHD